MTTITITNTNSSEISEALEAIDEIVWDRGYSNPARAEHSGKTVTLTIDDAVIRASVDKNARGEMLTKWDKALLRFNELVTKFESTVVLSDAEKTRNAETSKLEAMEKQIAQIRNQRGMTAEMLVMYEKALEAQRAKVAAL